MEMEYTLMVVENFTVCNLLSTVCFLQKSYNAFQPHLSSTEAFQLIDDKTQWPLIMTLLCCFHLPFAQVWEERSKTIQTIKVQFILRGRRLACLILFLPCTDCEGPRLCYVIGTWLALIGCVRTIDETERVD